MRCKIQNTSKYCKVPQKGFPQKIFGGQMRYLLRDTSGVLVLKKLTSPRQAYSSPLWMFGERPLGGELFLEELTTPPAIS